MAVQFVQAKGQTGTVKFYLSSARYGFLRPDGGGGDVFVPGGHSTAANTGSETFLRPHRQKASRARSFSRELALTNFNVLLRRPPFHVYVQFHLGSL
jgi:cold shock CspA family protein